MKPFVLEEAIRGVPIVTNSFNGGPSRKAYFVGYFPQFYHTSQVIIRIEGYDHIESYDVRGCKQDYCYPQLFMVENTDLDWLKAFGKEMGPQKQ